MTIESKSLMIGDWVKRFDKKFQIKAHQFTECNFEPIPLTPEILEKNGWKWASHRNDKVGTMDDLFISGVGHSYFFSDGRIEVYIYGYGIGHSGRGEYRGIINYVHELQHALRLCGLDELADNFKID